MKKYLIALIALLSVSFLFRSYFQPKKDIQLKTTQTQVEVEKQKEKEWKKTQIKIGDKNYEIFVTETDEDKNKGLSVFENIKDTQGMIFEFTEEDFHSFWMKDMKFDIDMIFLDKNKKVIKIFENVTKETYKNDKDFQIFMPALKSKYVIEIKSGEVKKNLLKEGDVIIF